MNTIKVITLLISLLLVAPQSFAKNKITGKSSTVKMTSPSAGTSNVQSGSADGIGVSPEGAPSVSTPEDALKKTQELLESREQRKENASRDPKAKQADDMVNQISGGNESMNDEIYALASKVFATLAQQANGDPKVMQELLMKFQRDPAGFVGTWSPEQKAKLKEIAGQMAAPVSPAPK